MRLINVHTLQLEEFFGDVPPYVILSHRWTDDEVSFKEFRKGLRKTSAGFRKIRDFCETARRLYEVDYAWADTVCIDKRSSAELAESINSMWAYYSDAACCFVHLNDVESDHQLVPDQDNILLQFRQSSWWTRGWTLQELLAPDTAIFFTSTWHIIGNTRRGHVLPQLLATYSRSDLYALIEDITHIPFRVLQDRQRLGGISVAQRMSWAAGRRTTRVEDEAYSLLGIFNIKMPLTYGEGRDAFRRLQLEIIRVSHDHSIFAWTTALEEPVGSEKFFTGALLAASPRNFARAACVRRLPSRMQAYAVTNHGLQLDSPFATLIAQGSGKDYTIFVVPLDCAVKERSSRAEDEPGEGLALRCYLVLARWKCGHYGRILNHGFAVGEHQPLAEHGKFQIHIVANDECNFINLSAISNQAYWASPDGMNRLAQIGLTFK